MNRKNNPDDSLIADYLFADNSNSHLYHRAQRRIPLKNEMRRFEKDERRRRDLQDKKKKTQTDFYRCLFDHRDNFFKFHKNGRFGSLSYTVLPYHGFV
jgi:hypothetical protein